MPVPYNCPSCGGSLPSGSGSGTVTCSYCGSTVKLEEGMEDRGRLPPEAMDEITALLRKGDSIGAIKVHRRHISGTLKESKEAVEAIAGNMGIAVRSGSCSVLALGALTALSSFIFLVMQLL